jgi:hypothetical protein
MNLLMPYFQAFLTTYFIYMLGLTSDPTTKPAVRQQIRHINNALACLVVLTVIVGIRSNC